MILLIVHWAWFRAIMTHTLPQLQQRSCGAAKLVEVFFRIRGLPENYA